MFYVENPNKEKPSEPTDFEISLYERGYKDEDLRGNDLEISLCQRPVTTQYIYISLSLLLSIQQSQQRQHTLHSTTNVIALSHIYTYMT